MVDLINDSKGAISIEYIGKGEKSRQEWKHELVSVRDSARGGMFDYYRSMYEYKLSCDGAQGGSTYSADCLSWLGISYTVSSRIATIGESKNKLFLARNCLPESKESLVGLLGMTDALFKEACDIGAIWSEMTIRDSLALRDFAEDYKCVVKRGGMAQYKADEGWRKLGIEPQKFEGLSSGELVESLADNSLSMEEKSRLVEEKRKQEEQLEAKAEKKRLRDLDIANHETIDSLRVSASAVFGVTGGGLLKLDPLVLEILYKALRAKVHPDKGYVKEDTFELEEAYEVLKYLGDDVRSIDKWC